MKTFSGWGSTRGKEGWTVLSSISHHDSFSSVLAEFGWIFFWVNAVKPPLHLVEVKTEFMNSWNPEFLKNWTEFQNFWKIHDFQNMDRIFVPAVFWFSDLIGTGTNPRVRLYSELMCQNWPMQKTLSRTGILLLLLGFSRLKEDNASFCSKYNTVLVIKTDKEYCILNGDWLVITTRIRKCDLH